MVLPAVVMLLTFHTFLINISFSQNVEGAGTAAVITVTGM
jgi:hypothetical protein